MRFTSKIQDDIFGQVRALNFIMFELESRQGEITSVINKPTFSVK